MKWIHSFAFATVFGERDRCSSLDTLLLMMYESRIVLYLCARHREKERENEERRKEKGITYTKK